MGECICGAADDHDDDCPIWHYRALNTKGETSNCDCAKGEDHDDL